MLRSGLALAGARTFVKGQTTTEAEDGGRHHGKEHQEFHRLRVLAEFAWFRFTE